MFKTTIKIEGMMCNMCEAHVNDAVRAAVSASKVNSLGTPALETQLLLRIVLRFVMIGFTYPGRLP